MHEFLYAYVTYAHQKRPMHMKRDLQKRPVSIKRDLFTMNMKETLARAVVQSCAYTPVPIHIKRDLQKRPVSIEKNRFHQKRPMHIKRDLQKRPVSIEKEPFSSKETYAHQKRPAKETCIHQKRPIHNDMNKTLARMSYRHTSVYILCHGCIACMTPI